MPDDPHSPSADARRAARAEAQWTVFAIVVIVVVAALTAFAGIHYATMPQGLVETANPSALHLDGEFVGSNLGSAIESDGSVTVRALGQQYSFTPQCILVPAATPLTIRAASADVIHGLLIEGTNVNVMLVPGYISVITARFEQPGEHLMPCQEFCSVGHEGMWGRVRVIDKAAFADLAAKNRRLSCVE